jgi:hypothetical protein
MSQKLNHCPMCGKLPKLISLPNYDLEKYPKTNGTYYTYFYRCMRNNHIIMTKNVYLTKDRAINGWNKL